MSSKNQNYNWKNAFSLYLNIDQPHKIFETSIGPCLYPAMVSLSGQFQISNITQILQIAIEREMFQR